MINSIEIDQKNENVEQQIDLIEKNDEEEEDDENTEGFSLSQQENNIVIEEQEETLINEIEQQQLSNQVTFQLDYLNEEDSEDDEFVVTIGDIKSNLVVPFGTAATLTKQTKSGGGGGGIITNGTTIDLDTNPILKDGTPIYDLDLATMEDKPWRKPGADITDYFNYGFNEETWNQYCERQRKFRQEFGSDQSAINKAICSNIQLTSSVVTSTGLTTFAGGRQLVNLSGGGGGGGQDKQQQKVQKIIVDLSKPPPINAEDSMLAASVVPVLRTVINETGVVRQESSEISFKTEQLDLNATTLVEHIPPISDTFIHSPISKTPPPIEQQQQPINVIDFSKPPPSFDPAIPPPLALVNQLPQQQQQVPIVSGISQVVVQTHQQQHSLTQTASAPLLSTAPTVTANLDLPPGVDESDGPPGISSSIPPVVSSMPPPAARILDFSQPPPTSQFSYNPTPTFPIGSNIGGPPGQQQQQPPSTFLPPSSGHYQTYAPRHFQPSYRHPFGGGGGFGRGGFHHERFRRGGGISRQMDDRERIERERERDRSDSGSDSGPSHRKKRRSRTRSRSRSPSTGRSRRRDDDRSSKHRSSDHKDKDRKRKKERDRSRGDRHRSSRRSPSVKKESRVKSERRSSDRDKDDRDARSRHRSSPRRKEKESSVKSELRVKSEQRSPEKD